MDILMAWKDLPYRYKATEAGAIAGFAAALFNPHEPLYFASTQIVIGATGMYIVGALWDLNSYITSRRKENKLEKTIHID